MKMDAAIQKIRRNPCVDEAKKGNLKGYFCFDINHAGTNYELSYGLEGEEKIARQLTDYLGKIIE